MEEKELWMNKLKEKLGDYSEPLPASGWEQLEKERGLKTDTDNERSKTE